jgi:malonyl-CoA O-methyltransferase
MVGIDRQRVKAAFHRQAGDYDCHARVQQRVVVRLLEQVQREVGQSQRILDVGAGTGRLMAGLHRLNPQALTVGVDLAFGMCRTARDNLLDRDDVYLLNSDAEQLPFAAGVFDLVISTSTYQWLSHLETAFREAYRVLAPGGMFCFALFGELTLFELKSSYRQALGSEKRGGEDRSHNFFSAAEVAAALGEPGFSRKRVDAECEVEYHPDVPELLRSLKRIGAGNAAAVAVRGLAERRVMLDMMTIYRREFGSTEGIPATYEVVYGIGWK